MSTRHQRKTLAGATRWGISRCSVIWYCRICNCCTLRRRWRCRCCRLTVLVLILTAAAAVVVVVVVVVGGRLLTRRPYRVRRDISNAFFGSSMRTLSGRFTLPKISSRAAAVPGHSVSQCSTVCGSSPHRGHIGSTVGSIKWWYDLNKMQWPLRIWASRTASLLIPPYGLWGGWPSRRRRLSVRAWWEGPEYFYWWNSMLMLLLLLSSL